MTGPSTEGGTLSRAPGELPGIYLQWGPFETILPESTALMMALSDLIIKSRIWKTGLQFYPFLFCCQINKELLHLIGSVSAGCPVIKKMLMLSLSLNFPTLIGRVFVQTLKQIQWNRSQMVFINLCKLILMSAFPLFKHFKGVPYVGHNKRTLFSFAF